MGNSEDLIVSVCMITYEHEKYIAQAIDSVLMQKTNFKYEIVIGEDCSTDKTREIVFEYEGKYPEIIRVITSDNNVGPIINWKRVYDKCNGKYIAQCEGDDFWNDELKLQKQVNFLENNPDYGIVHSDLNQLYFKKNKLIKNFNKSNGNKIPEGNIFNILLDPSRYIIKTVTALIIKELLDKHFEFNNALRNGWRLLDLPIWLEISNHCKIGYLEESTATYRVLDDSLSNIKSLVRKHEFHKMVFYIRYYYWEKYSKDENIKRKLDLAYYDTMIGDAFNMRDLETAGSIAKEMQSKAISLNLIQNLKYLILKVIDLLGNK